MDNENPTVYAAEEVTRKDNFCVDDEDTAEPIDALEIFEIVRGIKDPEHPQTLEELRVLQIDDIIVNSKSKVVLVNMTPTVPHCSQVTLIGLCVRVKLLRCLTDKFKVDIKIAEGSHNQEEQANKQLNDKERVAAALENANLMEVVNNCILGIEPN
eukprot:TRINITY_DN24369_c0_g1_i1.p1 TRINITY_DN24369_c0_g1~~TRINITY_DN24369_c0_g1_i1.p1  ORF type:complete len:171 (+),score=44.83 TRINITY_DN24369_c0_g1_i1:46-513(+)